MIIDMGQQAKAAIILICISFFIGSCSGGGEEKDRNLGIAGTEISPIKGLWSLKRGDSSYAEVYFEDSVYWFFQFDNHRLRPYQIKHENIFVSYSMTDTLEFELKSVGEERFTMTDGEFSTTYRKVSDSIFTQRDWRKIIEGDEELIRKYRLYFFAREFEARPKQ